MATKKLAPGYRLRSLLLFILYQFWIKSFEQSDECCSVFRLLFLNLYKLIFCYQIERRQPTKSLKWLLRFSSFQGNMRRQLNIKYTYSLYVYSRAVQGHRFIWKLFPNSQPTVRIELRLKYSRCGLIRRSSVGKVSDCRWSLALADLKTDYILSQTCCLSHSPILALAACPKW